jgi:uncharacterized membrane protein YeaQ/YmgE (transglycosylase-associated protein family)
MLILIIATGAIIGVLPALLKLDERYSITNILLGIAGAFVGAFLGFGDTPLFLKYPFLNEKTLMVAGSFLFVFIKVFITRRHANL